MSYENPTRLRIGMHGRFDEKDFRLIGRVVMGVEDDGETYYWNEFNLQTKSGESATLVFEESECGGEWRLFTELVPEYPMTAEDAATKVVGDRLNLTDDEVRVTLVDTSRVYRIEGEAPAGVRVGSVAKYFNAEAGALMQVVSWTGNDVEFYNGFTLSPGTVEIAFKLPRATAPKIFNRLARESSASSDGYSSGLKFFLQIAAVLVIFFIIFGHSLSCSGSRETGPVKMTQAPAPPLSVGASGWLHGTNYRITAHAVVEVDEVGFIFERHEYQLEDDLGDQRLLICGLRPDSPNWTFCSPFTPSLPISPDLAATNKTGDTIMLDGVKTTIDELFGCIVKKVDGENITAWKANSTSYGFAGQSSSEKLLARWDAFDITFYRGEPVVAKTVAEAFATPGK